MTWSILARDEKTGRFGIAVSTCAFAVGARVPFVAAALALSQRNPSSIR